MPPQRRGWGCGSLAGLMRGDVIKAVDGTSVSDVAGVLSDLKDKNPGDGVKLTITRDGQDQDIDVTLEARPEPLPRSYAFLPELNGIPRDQLFSHLMGGSFQFTDNAGNSHSVSVELGTVTAVDANAKTVSVDLNSGGSKTYDVTADVRTLPADLSGFQSGDHVVIVSVDGNLRALSKTQARLMPFFGGGPMRFGGDWDGFGMTGRRHGKGGF